LKRYKKARRYYRPVPTAATIPHEIQ